MRLNIKNMNVTQTCVKCLKSIICISENKYKLCNQCKRNKPSECIFCNWPIPNEEKLFVHINSYDHKLKRLQTIKQMFE